MKSTHVARVAGVLQAVLVAFHEKLEEKSATITTSLLRRLSNKRFLISCQSSFNQLNIAGLLHVIEHVIEQFCKLRLFVLGSLKQLFLGQPELSWLQSY